MCEYTKEELTEALRAINSVIGKCEKAQEKFPNGTSHHTLLKNRLKAMYISKTLIEGELNSIAEEAEAPSKSPRPLLCIGPIVIDCGINQAQILSEFYSRLLGWELSHPSQNGTAAITSPDKSVIAFQETETYIPPVWPWKAGAQGQMLHFDLIADDLEKAVQYAVVCGAKLAEEKYFDDSRTLFDPAGHTFCIDTYHG